MRKSILMLLSILLVGGAFAQKAPTTKLISSSEESIVVQFDLNGFSTAKVMTPEGEQFIVNVPKMASVLEAGAPDLPMFPVPAIIGDRAEMTVSVIDAQYTDYANMNIAPSKGNLSRQVNPADVPFTYGAMYQENAFWPATQAYLEAPYILRDFRGQNIMVRPFAYNPVTHTLRVYTHMTIEMTKVSNNGENQKTTRRSNTIKVDPEQKAQYSHRFINFGESTAKYIFDEDFGELLIICADAYMSNLQPLVEWKNMSGRPTTLVSLSTAGGNNAESIKTYVSNFYNDPDHNLEFLLLVGEYNELTPKNLGYGSGGTCMSDIWFGKLEGTDDYPEVLVGRFSVSNAADADLQVNKTIYYERDVVAGAAWGAQGLGIGHSDGPGHYNECDYEHIDFIRDTLLHYTYSQVTDIHGGSAGNANQSNISAAINQGISILNYCNHGSPTTWGVANYSTSNVAALTNNGMLPVVWSVACQNGQFDTGTCFGESWLRANQNGNMTGAVAGMFSYVSQPWQPPMYGQDEMNDILTEWRHTDIFNHTIGGVSINGSMYVLDMAPGDAYQTFNTWLLFGDPSALFRTDVPATMNVSANPAVLMLGMSTLTINADVNYAIATLSLNGEIIASGKVLNGQCTLEFDPLNNVGTADLIVLGYNKVTYMGTIDIVPAEGAYIVVDAHSINAEQANYGETIDMSIDLKNVGVEVANNLTATLTTTSEYVEILSGEGTIASMNPDEVVTLEGFQFSVAEDVPDKTNAEFILTITDGDDTWESTINILLHAPIIITDHVIQSIGHNSERILELCFMNTGSAPFYGGVLNIYSSSTDIVFETPTIEFNDTVAGNETITLSSRYTVDENAEPGSTYQIAYELNSGLLNVSDTFTLLYGSIQEDFESGVFGNNWTFSSQYPWTITTGGTKGNYCAKAGNTGVHSSESYMVLTVEVMAAGELTFSYKVSSESNYDKLHFYMDDQEKSSWSGNVSWSQYSQPVTAGVHTFKWSYTKDSSVSSNDDCAWIDDIVFPPVSITTFLDPVTNLEASVNDREVTLTWVPSDNATSFIVMRDGEEIDRTTEAVYNDYATYGTHLYSIIATNDEGVLSTPATITVEVEDIFGVGENNLAFEVYPNPVNSTLYINGGNAQYSYSLFNNMGQEMTKGSAQGAHRIDVSNMPKGLYFLKIASGSKTGIQKIVVE